VEASLKTLIERGIVIPKRSLIDAGRRDPRYRALVEALTDPHPPCGLCDDADPNDWRGLDLKRLPHGRFVWVCMTCREDLRDADPERWGSSFSGYYSRGPLWAGLADLRAAVARVRASRRHPKPLGDPDVPDARDR